MPNEIRLRLRRSHDDLVRLRKPISQSRSEPRPHMSVAAADAGSQGRGARAATARGKPRSRRNALQALHEAGDAAELNGDVEEKVGLHDLRHSLVAIALASGMSLPETAAIARHASPQVTAQVYAGLTETGREQLAGKLAEAFGS